MPRVRKQPCLTLALGFLLYDRSPRRLQNMILAVGPTTPAARPCGETRRSHDEDDDDEDESLQQDSSQSTTGSHMLAEDSSSDVSEAEGERGTHESADEGEEEESQNRESDDEAEEDEDVYVDFLLARQRRLDSQIPPVERSWKPSMRHKSCINTACWLAVPWRLSVNNNELAATVASRETPTQCITSGDDRLVKFWDVRHAMGSTSPVVGGWDVFTPFGTKQFPAEDATLPHSVSPETILPGAVLPLATLVSGHMGNVFHVTPVPSSPGVVLTCGADGQLRSCHVDRPQSSNLVMRPHADDDSDGDDHFMMSRDMAYSHQLLTAHTGLLCSDQGLFKFDIRLPSRQQPRQAFRLVANRGNGRTSHRHLTSIKACAVWSPSMGTEEATLDSNYVFAGGKGAEVHLFDLRMDSTGDDGNAQVVERYRPRILKNADVSVCGLDVSKDGRELLVSYESDQIYTFPILSEAKSAAGPTLDEMDAWSERYLADSDETVNDLASYGAHLNRFTFLKAARYAGPNDDYICTGSDSGHAWVYQKSTGAVVSLLSADSHVCNGVVPHPTLPIFISYGIDPTATVWRATLPVDPQGNESPAGRAEVASSRPYQMSPMVKNPEQVQQRCAVFAKPKIPMSIFPDFIPTSQEVLCAGRFMPNMLWAMVGGCDNLQRIGNALRTLPYLLRSNRYECCRAANFERNNPIEGPLENLAHRICMMRLRHQADQLGLTIDNAGHPYLWRVPEPRILSFHPADLVPNYPSDWIQLDPAMNRKPLSVAHHFLLEEYPTADSREDFYLKSLSHDSTQSEQRRQMADYPWLQHMAKADDDNFSWPLDDTTNGSDTLTGDSGFSSEDVLLSRKILYYTALLCKEGGNQALKGNMLAEAARRYDKGIQYCGLAFLSYEGAEEHVPHLTRGLAHRVALDSEGTRKVTLVYTWCPLLRVWVSCHLNLSLLFLKPELFRFQGDARNQAKIALGLLKPYTQEEGKVMHNEIVLRTDEPIDTFTEARALQAKAYFRLGSAELDMGDYLSAVPALEASLASTDGPNDPVVEKRLKIAKSRSLSQKKRNRRRFEVALAAGTTSDA
jgi:WD40 repeat protein